MPFLIGRMIHYNNPIYASDRYFTGTLNTVLGGFTAPNTVSFPLAAGRDTELRRQQLLRRRDQVHQPDLHGHPDPGGPELPAGHPGLRPGRHRHRPARPRPAGDVKNDFFTVEGTQTHACLYASLVQLRTLTIAKTVVGTPARNAVVQLHLDLDAGRIRLVERHLRAQRRRHRRPGP